MAARTVAESILTSVKRGARPVFKFRRRVVVTPVTQKYYHTMPIRFNKVSKSSEKPLEGDPIMESMKDSASPSGDNTTVVTQNESSKNAAFLGEADSDDGFEAHQETYPEAHRHHLSNVDASGIHGQSGEGDEPLERERRPLEPLDAKQSAYLGEADSDDAHESEREINPAKFRHIIQDASTSAYLGEGDSDDAHEVDRIVDPEKYRHRVDDPSSSGMHGQSGESDLPFEQDRK